MRALARVLLVLPVGPMLLGSSGCGVAALEASVRDLTARLQSSERAQAELSRKLEDADNKLFLVSDQLETQKLAVARSRVEPRLPVVAVAPPSTPSRAYPVEAPRNVEPASIGEPGGRR